MTSFIWNIQKRHIHRERKRESRLVVASAKERKHTGMGLFFWCDENALDLNSGGACITQFCESTKNHWMAYFRWVNYVVSYISIKLSEQNRKGLCQPTHVTKYSSGIKRNKLSIPQLGWISSALSKWKKPGPKGYTLGFHLFNIREKAKPRGEKAHRWFARGCRWDRYLRGIQVTELSESDRTLWGDEDFGVMDILCVLIGTVVTPLWH